MTAMAFKQNRVTEQQSAPPSPRRVRHGLGYHLCIVYLLP